MNRFKNYVWMAAGFAVLAAVVSGIVAAPGVAQLVKAALLKNVDERGRIPYQGTLFCATPATASACAVDGAAVGSGKRLVIEHVSANIRVSRGKAVEFAELRVGGGSDFQYLPAHYVSTPTVTDSYYINEQLILYVETGQTPSIFVQTASGNFISIKATITGYLVDLTL